MSVRRLAPKEQQPERFAFTADNLAWAKAQVAKYPEGRQASAVIPILWRAQEQQGWVPEAAIRAVADMLAMPYIRVLEVATFYTMFQLKPVGKKAHVQVCGTTPCRLRGADEIIKVCKNRIHDHPFELSADGDFSWEEVECLGACVNAPMVQVFKDTYEDLTPETFGKVLDGFASGNPPKPGSQSGRQFSAPQETPKGSAAASAAQAAEAPVPESFKPQSLSAARAGGPDYLKLIWGVGPKLEELLHTLGFFHFDQVAAWTEDNLKWVDQNLEGFHGRATRDKWVEQAMKLATGWRPSKDAGDKPF
jgi:NADH-quinone oxidoreductase subunit E